MTGKKTVGPAKRAVSPAKKSTRRAIVQDPLAPLEGLPKDYADLLDDLKKRIRTAQIKASLSAHRELLHLYWDIGRSIVQRQNEQGWGKAVVEHLSRDLQAAFPGTGGFSPQNIWRMRAFYLAWPSEFLAQPAREMKEAKKLAQPARELPPQPGPVMSLPWFHNVLLIQRIKDRETRLWYARQTVANGWSRNILALQIDTGLHLRQGKALTNFPATLPAPESDLAQETLKDPYVFDFLTMGPESRERDIENALVAHVRDFLLELGAGFAFVGQQVHLEVAEQDYYLDLLFYHLKRRCHIVVELKAGASKPEYAGQLNFYLSAVDDLLRHPDDKPTIGLLLCREKNRVTVEYALRDMKKPIGVSQWKTRLVEALPKALKGSLPSVEEIEKELGDEGLNPSFDIKDYNLEVANCDLKERPRGYKKNKADRGGMMGGEKKKDSPQRTQRARRKG